jgi:hypothetical protein
MDVFSRAAPSAASDKLVNSLIGVAPAVNVGDGGWK